MRLSLCLILFIHQQQKMFRILLASLLTVFAVAELPAQANTWTVEQVCEWVDSPGTEFQDPTGYFKDNVRKHGITGNILMVLEVNDLEEELGVKSSIERKKLMIDLDALENTYNGEAVLDFWSNRAINRQLVDYAIPLLGIAPRFGITTFDDFPAYCRPKLDMGEGQSTVIAWVEWLFFPEWYIFSNSDTIMCGIPGILKYTYLFQLILKCSLPFLAYVGSLQHPLITGPMAFGIIAVVMMGMPLIMELVGWCIATMGWYIFPYLPWWLCDITMYSLVYITPLKTIYDGVLSMISFGTGNAFIPKPQQYAAAWERKQY